MRHKEKHFTLNLFITFDRGNKNEPEKENHSVDRNVYLCCRLSENPCDLAGKGGCEHKCNKGEGLAHTCSCVPPEDYKLVKEKMCEKSKQDLKPHILTFSAHCNITSCSPIVYVHAYCISHLRMPTSLKELLHKSNDHCIILMVIIEKMKVGLTIALHHSLFMTHCVSLFF